MVNMKKSIKFFLLLLSVFFLCACREKKDYNLIEVTSEELVQNLFSEEKNSYVFAVVNASKDGYKQFMKDLKSLTKSAKMDVYYIDYNFMDVNSSLYLYNIDGLDFSTNSYFGVVDGSVKVAEYYNDFGSMYADLKNIKPKGDFTKVDEDTKNSYLEGAKKLYNEGKIGLSFDLLSKASNLSEAKSFYNESKYYKLLISWEAYDFKDADMKDVTYYSLIFYLGVNSFNLAQKEGKYDENFDKDFYYEDYDQLYYYVKDDIIYTTKKEDEKYTKTYQILSLSSNRMMLKDLKSGKEYAYSRY